MKATITKTRTVGGIKWECTEEEGLWFATAHGNEYMIGRASRKGRRSEWELSKNGDGGFFAKTCGDLMDMAARNAV
jgi:hypothetical protein